MTRFRTALCCSFVLGILATYCYRDKLPKRSPFASAHAQQNRMACQFLPNETLAFQIKSSAEIKEPGHPEPRKIDLDAVMWWRIAEQRSAQGWVVAAMLSQVHTTDGSGEADSAGDSALQTPFSFQIGTDCRIRDLAFPSDAETESKQKRERLVRSLEVILSPLPVVQWVSQHQDELGLSQVQYIVDKNGSLPLITMQRLRYASAGLPWIPQFGGRLSIQILDSQTQASFDEDGRWLRDLAGRENLRITIGDRLFGESVSSISLRRLESPGSVPANLAQVDPHRMTAAKAKLAQVSTEPRELAKADPVLQAMDLSAALTDFEHQLAASKDGLFKATERLASYLAGHPQEIDELLARIRSGTISAKLHSALFLALERTGTLAAEKALTQAMNDRGQDRKNRMRAAAALQDIPKPSQQTVSALVEESKMQGSADDHEVAKSALLALGALSHRMLDKKPELSQLVRQELGARLHSARDSAERDVLLDAIGNSGDKELSEQVRPFLKDSASDVRAHAAQALRRMPLSTMEPILREQIGQESDPLVRRAIAGAIAEGVFQQQKGTDAETVVQFGKQLQTESDPKVRAALIAVLGASAQTDENARQALAAQFAKEPMADLKILIGRYVSADLLR